jgi:hypothetical protein
MRRETKIWHAILGCLLFGLSFGFVGVFPDLGLVPLAGLFFAFFGYVVYSGWWEATDYLCREGHIFSICPGCNCCKECGLAERRQSLEETPLCESCVKNAKG